MGKKILVIDDEPELVKAVQIRLESNGYEVEVAYDGQVGLDKAKQVKPDLILLDIIMPKMDGYEVAKKLMAIPETENIPIVVFTASQQRDLEDRCRELGITTFVKKPFESTKLLELVNKVLQD